MPKRKPGPKAEHKKTKRRPIDWIAVRQRYLVENLDPEREKEYTLADVARDFKISVDNVRKVARKEDWTGELRKQQAQISEETITRTREHHIQIELELRERQAELGRLYQDVSRITIEDLKEKQAKLQPKEAMDLGRHGAELERKARGVPDRLDVHSTLESEEHEGFESPETKMARERADTRYEKLLKRIAAEEDDDAEDETSE